MQLALPPPQRSGPLLVSSSACPRPREVEQYFNQGRLCFPSSLTPTTHHSFPPDRWRSTLSAAALRLCTPTPPPTCARWRRSRCRTWTPTPCARGCRCAWLVARSGRLRDGLRAGACSGAGRAVWMQRVAGAPAARRHELASEANPPAYAETSLPTLTTSLLPPNPTTGVHQQAGGGAGQGRRVRGGGGAGAAGAAPCVEV